LQSFGLIEAEKEGGVGALYTSVAIQIQVPQVSRLAAAAPKAREEGISVSLVHSAVAVVIAKA
jgi:hypothetical protein